MIRLEQISENIVIYHWEGNISVDENRQTFEEYKTIKTEPTPYIAIVNMENVKALPFNIPKIQTIIKDEMKHGLQAYILYGAPLAVSAITKTLAVLAPTTYHFCDTRDEAILLANEFL